MAKNSRLMLYFDVLSESSHVITDAIQILTNCKLRNQYQKSKGKRSISLFKNEMQMQIIMLLNI